MTVSEGVLHGCANVAGKEPQITVVVTVHNAEAYVRQCLNSLAAQDTQCFHLVVVDDGSTDNSLNLCRTIINQAGVSSVLKKLPHGGVAKARNYGLEQVNTEDVLFLDCDDWLEPDTISSLLELLRKDRPELAVFGFYYAMMDGKQYPVSSSKVRSMFSRESIRRQFVSLWSSGLMYSSCNKIFQVKLLRENGIVFQERSFGEDFEFCKDVMRVCSRLVISDRCLYHYTCHISGSLSTAYREDLFEIRLKEHCGFVDYFRELGCMDEHASEFLARRHIERVVGCVENECSPASQKSIRERLRRIRIMLDEENTRLSAEEAHLTSLRMKLLVLPIRKKWYCLTMLSGYVMTFCRNHMPEFFTWLKMSR